MPDNHNPYIGTWLPHVLLSGVERDYPLKLLDGHIHYIYTLHHYVLLSGAGHDHPLNLLDGHIPYIGTLYLYVWLCGAELDYPLKLLDSHIHCNGTLHLHVLCSGVERADSWTCLIVTFTAFVFLNFMYCFIMLSEVFITVFLLTTYITDIFV